MWKLDSNENVSLDHFAFVRRSMGEEVSMGYVEEEECLVCWGWNISLIDLQLSGSLTEEGTGAGKDNFEGGFKFASSESRNKFNSIASAQWGAIGEISERERYWAIAVNLWLIRITVRNEL